MYSRENLAQIENKYGMVAFRMGFYHLMDVGIRHLTPENVEATKKKIHEDFQHLKPNEIPVMTEQFQCDLVDIAAELAQFSITDLMVYIKTELEFDGISMFEGHPIEICNNLNPWDSRIIFVDKVPDEDEYDIDTEAEEIYDEEEHQHDYDYTMEDATMDAIRNHCNTVHIKPEKTYYF